MCIFDWDLLIKFLTLITAAIVAYKGIKEYKNNLKWKKAEFLSKQYSEFLSSEYVQNSFQILDGFELPISVLQPDGQIKIIISSREKLEKSLEKNAEGVYNKNWESTYMRYCIDKFLFKLGSFHTYHINDLATKSALDSYLSYWIDLIGNKEKTALSPNLQAKLISYIKENNFSSVASLLQLYGYTI